MYLYIFMLFLTASLRNDALGGLTYIIPDDYYQLNAYDFGNLSAGLVMDDNGMSYAEGFYLVGRDSIIGNTYRGYGHLRFNNNQKFALDIKFNDMRFNWPLATDPMGNPYPYTYKTNILESFAEIATYINNKIIIGTGWENRNYKEGEENDFPLYSFSYNRMDGSLLYINNIFNIGSKIEYMKIKGDFYEVPYKRITAAVYSLIPITDNLRLAGMVDGITEDTLKYFGLRIHSEFTPMKEIIIGAEIKAANFIELDSLSYLYLLTSSLSKVNNQSITFGIGYKNEHIFVGVENCIRRVKWSFSSEYWYYSTSRLGAEIYKRNMYVRAGINAKSNGSTFNFSFGLGYSKDKLDIDYLYNYGKGWYWLDYPRGGTNALSIRIKF